MPICKNCGSELMNIGTGYKCKFCRNTYSYSDFEIKKVQEQLDPTSKILNLSASDVYEKTINGVAIIHDVENSSTGAGFVLTKDGYVITNSHVVYNNEAKRASNNLYVDVANKTYKATSVYCNPPFGDNDVALLKLDTDDKLQALKLGDSDYLKNGEEVVAIGNPKGEGISITRGIVSDRCRKMNDGTYIMSDVAINPGNSGGPLFNEKGEVVAICRSIRLEAFSMSYFIPINHIKCILKEWRINT
ncbi:trypsin-like peptidase domain-containing protein [bacterium]|nr:trypsin-like peptidase domain-containing protein [bacterium]